MPLIQLVQKLLNLIKPLQFLTSLKYLGKLCFHLVLLICLSSFSESPSFPLLSNLRNSSEHFVGRDKLLKDMHGFLFHTKNNYYLVVSGSAGAGKTQVISRFAELHKTNYHLIWWLDVKKDLSEQYRNFAKQWNKLVTKHYKDAAEQNYLQINIETINYDSIAEEVRDRLNNTKLNWLIILDNVKDTAVALKDLPKHNDKGYGHIIISTQNNTHHANVMNIKEFSLEESIDLLLKTTGEDDKNQASALANTLGNYPLAVSKAGTYIASIPAMNIEEYNRLFLTKRKELWEAENQLRIDREPINCYKNTVLTTLSMDINQIKKESMLAYEILAIVAFFDNEDIPEDLLAQYVKTKHGQDSIDINLKSALATLMKYSLLTNNHNDHKLQNKSNKKLLFSTYEIMQIVMRDTMSEEEKQLYLNQAIISMNQILPNNIYVLTDLLSERSYLVPHITALNSHATNLKLYNHDVLQLKMRALEYNLPGIRNDKEAERLIGHIEEIQQRILQQQKEEDEDKDKKTTTDISLFKWFDKQSDETQALQQNKHDNVIKENKTRDDLLKIRFAIMKSAFFAWVKADYSESLREALYANELIKGLPENSYPEEALMIYNRLARLYNVTGDNTKAFQYADLGKQIVNTTKELVGYQNDFYKILVKIYIDSDDYNQALKYSDLTLATLNLQNKSSSGYISANIIHADILIRMGRYKQAMQKLNELEQIAETSLSQDNIYRANIMNYHSYVSAQLGINNLQQDIQTSLAAQAMLKKLLGEKSYYKSRHVFMNHKFLGEIYEKSGDDFKSEQEYSIGLRILTNIYSHSGHAVTDDLSDIYAKLAIVNAKLKRPEKALLYLNLHRQAFGQEHIRSISIEDYFIDNNLDISL